MPKEHAYSTYIMASKRNGTLYVGVTNDIYRRAQEHARGDGGVFTKLYGCKLLVWYESHQHIEDAIRREKFLKKGTRKSKLALIEAENPDWVDLANEMRV